MNEKKSDQGTLRLRCPDCGSALVVDAATGRVLTHEKPKGPPGGGKDFDSLLAGLDESKSRADEVFNRELSGLKDRDRLMEETFRERLRQVEEEPEDEPPVRPWDLD